MKKIFLLIEFLGNIVLSTLGGLGRFILFLREVLRWTISPPFRIGLIFKQLEFVGNKSSLIIFIAAFFVGAVLGLQLGVIFRLFSAEGLMGAATGKSLALELGPVMCGFIVIGRAGAAMAAEIATMRVNEQIDAIEAMGVNPVSYLVVPRVIASVIMMPILAGIFLFVGVVGCYIVAIFYYRVDTMVFFQQLQWIVWWSDVVKGLVKATFFGFIFATIACYKGFNAKGGAKGVGEATTRAVVVGLLSILVGDFIITLFQI
ncbi:MlaE family ABC transporter permease [Fluviispira multicolorata]|uniref:MlaE family lipid ABC transporter permease subunit n=1 Tax=Fluviispira multicolorata TaxID=2654512 RepID=A0A833N3J2_9BACT|nr:ABC transporter permease [Fluviispira multicolorata]KAB8029924.1 MlaE family lipid ABC transporter permease subunit [Fluviispira multicolorata]